MNINLSDASSISLLVPIDEAKVIIDGAEISIKNYLNEIESNVKLSKNSFYNQYMYPFNNDVYWAEYNGVAYNIATNTTYAMKEERQAAIQILKIMLETSSIKDKVSVYDFRNLKIKLIGD